MHSALRRIFEDARKGVRPLFLHRDESRPRGDYRPRTWVDRACTPLSDESSKMQEKGSDPFSCTGTNPDPGATIAPELGLTAHALRSPTNLRRCKKRGQTPFLAQGRIQTRGRLSPPNLG